MSWLLITIIVSCFLFHEQSCVEGKRGLGSGDQDWGHVKVRDGAYMFWWLYYANPPHKSWRFDPHSKPLLIWIQGGPGSPGTAYGNFEEFGPLDIDMKKRSHTWVKDYNVLLIDTPVGTGFSYVEDNSKLASTDLQMCIDLYQSILSFLKSHPKFQTVPTYILAESYGGKVASMLALLLAKTQNTQIGIKSNLKGIGLGDSFISPADVVSAYAPYLLHTGMINSDCYKTIDNLGKHIKNSMDTGKWTEAANLFLQVLWKNIFRCTNGIDLFNILEQKVPRIENGQNLIHNSGTRPQLQKSNFDERLRKLMDGKVKKALGVTRSFNMHSNEIKKHLINDYMKPMNSVVERLLNETNLKVFVYNGQLDVIVPIASTLAWIQKLAWPGANNWQAAQRMPITVDNTLEGFVQGDEKLKMFWVNRAGHMVPKDNYYAMDVILKMLTSE